MTCPYQVAELLEALEEVREGRLVVLLLGVQDAGLQVDLSPGPYTSPLFTSTKALHVDGVKKREYNDPIAFWGMISSVSVTNPLRECLR